MSDPISSSPGAQCPSQSPSRLPPRKFDVNHHSQLCNLSSTRQRSHVQSMEDPFSLRVTADAVLSLPIMFPSIPEGGTKSRVETQVRLTVDLAHASASSGEPLKYDRVGSWKWLRLPKGTSTKRRTRKEGKIGRSCLRLALLDSVLTAIRCDTRGYPAFVHGNHLCFSSPH